MHVFRWVPSGTAGRRVWRAQPAVLQRLFQCLFFTFAVFLPDRGESVKPMPAGSRGVNLSVRHQGASPGLGAAGTLLPPSATSGKGGRNSLLLKSDLSLGQQCPWPSLGLRAASHISESGRQVASDAPSEPVSLQVDLSAGAKTRSGTGKGE